MIKFSKFFKKVYSQAIQPAIKSGFNLVGVSENTNENIRINIAELFSDGSNLGSGSNVYKDNTEKTLNFRSLTSDNTIELVENTNEILMKVKPGNLDLATLTGILPLNKGGTGISLTAPSVDSLFAYSGSSKFVTLGNNLFFDGNILKVSFPDKVTAKGQLLTHDGSNESVLPPGNNGQALIADSTQSKGLKWSTINLQESFKTKISNAKNPGFLGETPNTGILRTDATISKAPNQDAVVLGVKPGNLNTSDFNNNAGFEQYFDSGWNSLYTYSSSNPYGLYPLTENANPPMYRIINRVVFFKGVYIVPLENAGNLVLNTSDYYNTFSSDVAFTDTGLVNNTNGSIQTPPLFSNDILYPGNDFLHEHVFTVRRIKELNSNNALSLQSVINIIFRENGILDLVSLYDREDPIAPFIGAEKDFLIRHLITVANANDYNLNFANYRTTMDGAGTTNLNYAQGSYQYPFSFDGSRWDNLGGCKIKLDGMFYHIDKNTSISQIKSAFESL